MPLSLQSAVVEGGIDALIDANRKKPNLMLPVHSLSPIQFPSNGRIPGTCQIPHYAPQKLAAVSGIRCKLAEDGGVRDRMFLHAITLDFH